jgi:N-acyl-L-homoserine lactone synthetase
MTGTRLAFKIADRPEEFEAIHRLNYRTFVEEIPQHAANPEGRLVDRFHEQNVYLVCVDGSEVVGMLALRTDRPFSLDLKLPNLDELLPPGRRIGEVRLLAVDRSRRHSTILPGLFRLVEREALGRGLTMLIVSATTRQRRLYDRLGFVPFGPLVGSEQARFQPMCLTLERFREVEPTYAWRSGGQRDATEGEGQ